MRKMWCFIIGSLAVACVHSLEAEAAIRRPVYDIRCERFFDASEKMEGGLSKRSTFKSAKLALQQLELADKYPIYPNEQAAVLKKALAAKGKDAEISALLSIQAPCDPAHYFAWSTRLIRSAKTYRFHTADRNRLASVLMTHFRSNALEPRPVLQELLDLKLLRYAKSSGILKLSSKQKITLNDKSARIDQIGREVLAREAEIEKLKSQVGEPADSLVEKDRRQKLARLEWEQLLDSEELRAILQEILEFVEG